MIINKINAKTLTDIDGVTITNVTGLDDITYRNISTQQSIQKRGSVYLDIGLAERKFVVTGSISTTSAATLEDSLQDLRRVFLENASATDSTLEFTYQGNTVYIDAELDTFVAERKRHTVDYITWVASFIAANPIYYEAENTLQSGTTLPSTSTSSARTLTNGGTYAPRVTITVDYTSIGGTHDLNITDGVKSLRVLYDHEESYPYTTAVQMVFDCWLKEATIKIGANAAVPLDYVGEFPNFDLINAVDTTPVQFTLDIYDAGTSMTATYDVDVRSQYV